MKTVTLCHPDAEERVFFAVAVLPFLLPDREDPAEIVHDVVEFNLQVFQDLTGLLTQLKSGHRNTTVQL